MAEAIANLYVHFPFCRRRCTYCVLFSRVGKSEADRADYVAKLAGEISRLASPLKTVYFGGGSPGMCDLRPVLAALEPLITNETEFSVELHPEDVTDELLATLAAGGVNRISMGLQSLDAATLKAMNRGYSPEEAARAFGRVRRIFGNAGVDLIVGFPGDRCDGYSALANWGLSHCSVYSLQNERKLKHVPSDEWTCDRLGEIASFLETIKLKRYEISNYALPGAECRHNLATWRGEDYFGLGEGAFGRVGLTRTESGRVVETVSPERDELERKLFSLRTRYGLDAGGHDEWLEPLERFVREGLLVREGYVFRLTSRGTEVCDTILTELVV